MHAGRPATTGPTEDFDLARLVQSQTHGWTKFPHVFTRRLGLLEDAGMRLLSTPDSAACQAISEAVSGVTDSGWLQGDPRGCQSARL